jgi:hypothetical protein
MWPKPSLITPVHRARAREISDKAIATTVADCRAVQYYPAMATAHEVEKLALDLAEKERAVLAAHLLKSLPAVLDDADEGMAEALQRDKDLDANPNLGISVEQLEQQVQRRRA